VDYCLKRKSYLPSARRTEAADEAARFNRYRAFRKLK
jgi:hypothetical protein